MAVYAHPEGLTGGPLPPGFSSALEQASVYFENDGASPDAVVIHQPDSARTYTIREDDLALIDPETAGIRRTLQRQQAAHELGRMSIAA